MYILHFYIHVHNLYCIVHVYIVLSIVIVCNCCGFLDGTCCAFDVVTLIEFIHCCLWSGDCCLKHCMTIRTYDCIKEGLNGYV